MRQKKNRNAALRAAVSVGIIAALLLGCDHANRGIFAQIEEEVRVNQANDGENGVVHSMVRVGDRYYAAANRLFWRDANADGRDWGTINTPNPSYQHVVSVAATTVPAMGADAETELVLVAVTNSNSEGSQLYSLDPGTHQWSGNLFRDDAGTAIGDQIVRLISVGDGENARLAIISKRRREIGYNLRFYDHKRTPGTDNDDTAGPTAPFWENVPEIIDGASITSGAGVDFLVFADRANLYCIHNTTSPTQVGIFELRRIVVDRGNDADPDASLVGGVYARSNILYVTAGRGNLYLYRSTENDAALCSTDETGPTDWADRCPSANPAAGDPGCWEESTFGDTTHAYTDLVWYDRLVDADGITTGGLVVGIRDNGRVSGGYREIIGGIPTAANLRNPRGTSYTSTELRNATVSGLVADGTKLFLLSQGRGMWRASYNLGTPTMYWDLSR